jgi:C1A family cysteine protease
MSIAYQILWTGPVNTSDDPHNDTSIFSSTELGLPIHRHVQNVTFFPTRNGSTDNLEIKKAILNYGAVANAMYFDPYNTEY